MKILLAAALAAACTVAWSQTQTTYRCTAKNGKKYYGSTVPTECLGQPVEQLNSQGLVIRRIDAQGDQAAREAKKAAAAKKREEDRLANEESRRNRALLATYTSEKDIDDARARALEDHAKSMKQVQDRMAEIKKRLAGYDQEMEFYRDAGKADKGGKSKTADSRKTAPKPPPKLLEDIQNAQTDLKAQEGLLAAKQKEAETINAKYDEDKKRYAELTRPAKK